MSTAMGPRLPPELERMFAGAMALAARGDLRQAADAILRVRDMAPGSVEVATLASVIMLQQGRYRAARRLALEASALRVQPGDLLRIARLLRRFEESEALERMFLASAWRELDSAPALAEVAQLLGFSGLYDLAFECLSHAGSIDPAAPDIHYLRGLFLMFSGDMAGSRESVRRALELEPRMVNAHWLLSMQEKA